MSIYRIFLIVTIFSTFCFCLAQELPKQNQANAARSDAMRMEQKRLGKAFLRSSWNGTDSLSISLLLFDPEIRKNWDVSDEQYDKIKKLQSELPRMLQKHPDFVAINEEIKKLKKPDDPFFQNADEKTKQKFEELRKQSWVISEKFNSQEFGKLFTPEQKRQIKEYQLATMSEFQMISATMFDALDLSEDQKQKIASIKKEFDPDFEHIADEIVDAQMAFSDKLETKRDKKLTNIKEILENIKQTVEHDEELQKLLQELIQKGQTFVTRVKFKMFDVLTDEQMEKLQNLIDHPPDYIKTKIAEMKKMQGKSIDPIQALLNSWKPGDPIPEEYKKHRNSRKTFPTEEK